MSWRFEAAAAADIDQLMTWFADAHSVDIWGGPKFRYPFTRETFHEDCRWQEFSSHCLRDADGELAAFGQLGSRYERSHLARLVVSPGMRGAGVGKRLLTLLIDEIRQQHNDRECGLFVYKDNEPAYHCYLSLGFKVKKYPKGAPMRAQCHYMIKMID